MSEPPPFPPLPFPDQRKVDADQLKLLCIFHFIGAGLALVGILFLVLHYTLFRTFLADPNMWAFPKQSPPPANLFLMMKWFYLVAGIWFLGSSVLNAVSGLCIRARKHRTFTLVVAGMNCLHMPLGTLLGVFTIIVLVRDSVRKSYE
jgi:hypothetical protein